MNFVDLRGFTSEQSTILLCTNLVEPRKLISNARTNLVKPRKSELLLCTNLVEPRKLISNARANLVKPRKSESGFQSPRVDLAKPRKSTVDDYCARSLFW